MPGRKWLRARKGAGPIMKEYTRPYLQQIESEAIYVLREVAGQFDNPALLFSGGKDSIDRKSVV